MNDRELATVLAALRMWQHATGLRREEFEDIANDFGRFKPLTIKEVDKLREKLQTIPLEWTKEETQAREA